MKRSNRVYRKGAVYPIIHALNADSQKAQPIPQIGKSAKLFTNPINPPWFEKVKASVFKALTVILTFKPSIDKIEAASKTKEPRVSLMLAHVEAIAVKFVC